MRWVEAWTCQRLPDSSTRRSAIPLARPSRSASMSTSAKVPSSSPSMARMSVISWRAKTALPAPMKVTLGTIDKFEQVLTGDQMVTYALGVEPVFKALADVNRRKLLDRLFERDGQTLTELAGCLPAM